MELVPLCNVTIDVGAMHEIGKTPFGQRAIGDVIGARWEGDLFRAKMIGSAAADWALRGDDGLIHVDVRMTLEADGGELVFVSYTGLMDTLAEGIPIRTSIRFETASDRYQWLTRTLCVGDGRYDGERVRYEVFALR